MTPCIVAPYTDAIGIGELSLIAIGGAIEDDRARAFWQQDAVQIIVARPAAREILDRRFYPQISLIAPGISDGSSRTKSH